MLLQVVVIGVLATHVLGVAASLLGNSIDLTATTATTANGKMDPFLKMLQGVKKYPVGKLPENKAANFLVADDNICHIDIMVPQKVLGKCLAHAGNPMCVSNDKMEINYNDCLLIEAKNEDWRRSQFF